MLLKDILPEGLKKIATIITENIGFKNQDIRNSCSIDTHKKLTINVASKKTGDPVRYRRDLLLLMQTHKILSVQAFHKWLG